MLESLPESLFHMKSLEMLNVDRNHLVEIPNTVRSRAGGREEGRKGGREGGRKGGREGGR